MEDIFELIRSIAAMDFLLPWHWIIMGIVLISIEILVPITFFLWIGTTAILVGVAAYALSLSPFVQLSLFIVGAPIVTIIGRILFPPVAPHQQEVLLNRRGEQLIGKSFILAEAIINGRGRLRVGDSFWLVQGPDLPKGHLVKVIDTKGNILIVVKEELH